MYSHSNLITLLACAWVISLSITSVTFAEEVHDTRQTIYLTAEQRQHVLHEMRALLTGTQTIITYLAAGDMQQVEQHARALGLQMGQKAEDRLHSALPKAFMQQGMALHMSFDTLADEVKQNHDPQQILSQLAKTLTGCQGCHELYRLDSLVPAKAEPNDLPKHP